MQTPDFYLVIDLEATCDRHHRIPREQTEIIEIGAVCVERETLQVVDEWQTFVRPVLVPTLTAFCTKLTSITQADVATAPDFVQALDALREYVAGRSVLFCSWGDYDRAQLAREATRHAVQLPWPDQHLNIKQCFMEQAGDGLARGVNKALAHLGLRFEGTMHRGIDDARNTARLLAFALGRAPAPPDRQSAS